MKEPQIISLFGEPSTFNRQNRKAFEKEIAIIQPLGRLEASFEKALFDNNLEHFDYGILYTEFNDKYQELCNVLERKHTFRYFSLNHFFIKDKYVQEYKHNAYASSKSLIQTIANRATVVVPF
jgi:hypothetical protein